MKISVILAMALSILTSATANASESVSISAPISLACPGKAETTKISVTEHVVSEEGDVRVYLEGDGGTAEIPRFIGGPKEGRLTVKFFSVSDTLITGKINYRSIGNAKFRIDRVAGTLAITGPLGNFSGRCQKLDQAQAAPKF